MILLTIERCLSRESLFRQKYLSLHVSRLNMSDSMRNIIDDHGFSSFKSVRILAVVINLGQVLYCVVSIKGIFAYLILKNTANTSRKETRSYCA